MLKLMSNQDPRFLTHGLGLIRLLPTVMEHESSLSSCCRVPTSKNSVLSSSIINLFSFRSLSNARDKIIKTAGGGGGLLTASARGEGWGKKIFEKIEKKNKTTSVYRLMQSVNPN